MEAITETLANISIAADSNDKRCVLSMEEVEEMLFDDFTHKNSFIKVCDVVMDDNTNRKTTIKFAPVIGKDEWKEHCEWVYMFTCDKRILKIGGTRTGLLKRTQSYLCGRPEFRAKGTCSTTNYVIYKSFNTLLCAGHSIEMWAYRLQQHTIDVEDFGMKLSIPVQTFHVFETKMLEEYKNQKGKYPVLSSNADKRFID
jgi:hypothetical protein